MLELVSFVKQQLSSAADPEKAVKMAVYMKTEMPFYGVQSGQRREIAKKVKRKFAVESREAYEEVVLGLWNLPHREEKYIAISLARLHRRFIGPDSLPLYEKLIREGAWWDFVDEVAVNLVGVSLLADPGAVWPIIDRWIDDRDMWIRRSAILCQNKHKRLTDSRRLFCYCLARSYEKEFFIRKAIGWALREYAYTAPEEVLRFLLSHRNELSPLSFREAARPLQKKV